jgi:hypothetical protein
VSRDSRPQNPLFYFYFIKSVAKQQSAPYSLIPLASALLAGGKAVLRSQSRNGSVSQCCGSGSGRFQKSDPGPVKNHPDPQHCIELSLLQPSRIKNVNMFFWLFAHYKPRDKIRWTEPRHFSFLEMELDPHQNDTARQQRKNVLENYGFVQNPANSKIMFKKFWLKRREEDRRQCIV